MAELGVELDCLEGVKVVDFTQFEAGPSCTEVAGLARRRGGQDREPENRRSRPPSAGPGAPDNDPWYFHQFNANKKSLTLEFEIAARPRDRQAAA